MSYVSKRGFLLSTVFYCPGFVVLVVRYHFPSTPLLPHSALVAPRPLLRLDSFCSSTPSASLTRVATPREEAASSRVRSCRTPCRNSLIAYPIVNYKVAPPAGNSCCRNFLPGNLIFAFTENLSNETEFASPTKWWHLKSANTLSLLMKNPLIQLFLSSFA